MIQISKEDRELMAKLHCFDEAYDLLSKQLEEHFKRWPEDMRDYWPAKCGYLMSRLRGLLAAVRAHEEMHSDETMRSGGSL